MRNRAKILADRAAALARAQAANALAVNDVMPPEALESFNAEMTAIEGFDAEIAALDATEASDAARTATTTARARLAAAAAPAAPRSVPTRERAVITDLRQRSEADPTRGFRSFGEYAMAVMQANPNVGGRASELLAPLAAASGMSQGTGSDGGFLVPPQFSTAIWDGLNNPADSLLAMTDSYPVLGDSLTMNANAETSRANGSRYGGVQAFWLAEAAQATKSKPTFRQMKLEPHGLAALVYVTDKLLRNAGALDAYLARAAADEINFVVGDAIINGTGAGQPLGIMKSTSLVTVNKETSQAANTVVQANISKMWARLHPRCRKNAVWLYNVEVEPQFDGLNLPIKNVAGTENVGGISNVVWNAEKNLLKGRPVIPIEYCAGLSSLGDIILADLSMYATGNQGGVESAVSMHLRFDFAEQAFRFMFYVDGQPWLASPLTPYKGSSTLSSFVTLQAR